MLFRRYKPLGRKISGKIFHLKCSPGRSLVESEKVSPLSYYGCWDIDAFQKILCRCHRICEIINWKKKQNVDIRAFSFGSKPNQFSCLSQIQEYGSERTSSLSRTAAYASWYEKAPVAPGPVSFVSNWRQGRNSKGMVSTLTDLQAIGICPDSSHIYWDIYFSRKRLNSISK